MILGIGTDIVDVAQFERRIERGRLLRVFSGAELAYADENRAPHADLGRAVGREGGLRQSLGTGIRAEWNLDELEVVSGEGGKPSCASARLCGTPCPRARGACFVVAIPRPARPPWWLWSGISAARHDRHGHTRTHTDSHDSHGLTGLTRRSKAATEFPEPESSPERLPAFAPSKGGDKTLEVKGLYPSPAKDLCGLHGFQKRVVRTDRRCCDCDGLAPGDKAGAGPAGRCLGRLFWGWSV